MLYEVIPTRLFRENASILTYSSEEKLSPGTIVKIPLGRSTSVGIVTKPVKSVDFPTKPISSVLYPTPVPSHIMKAMFWLSEYYLVPLPLAAKLFLPQGLGKTRRKARAVTARESDSPTSYCSIPLNPAQKHALEALETASKATKLLHGVTSSGKTNIYQIAALKALKQQKSTILLVPEIALTSQLVQVFKQTFGDNVFLIHSRQTEVERQLIWENILTSDQPQIIIGPRSALLSPVKNLGLILIDEAHESTYYQDNTPKYSSLRLASFIASSEHISCIYGTATPLVSDYYLAKKNDSLVTLSEKAKSSAIPPDIKIIDLKNRENFTKNRYFSDALLSAIDRNLKNHHQTLIFHNRRGSAPLTICENCGWQALCPSCFLPLTLHADSYTLRCHACGYSTKVPSSCPDCGLPDVIHKGFGTKLLETELSHLYKTAKIIRFDADNAKSDTLDAKYQEVKSGKFDILIGTQTIAKGLDLPLLATVGIVQADSGLNLPDFASEERTFHLLTQVIGRVGRGHLDTAEVFIQTYQPDHPAITSAIHSDYASFYAYSLKSRKKGHLPPFYYLAKLSLTYKTEATVLKYIRSYESSLHSLENSLENSGKLLVSAPTPAFHEKSTRGFTWQIILRSTSRNFLLSILKSLPKNPHLHFSIDPPSLL